MLLKKPPKIVPKVPRQRLQTRANTPNPEEFRSRRYMDLTNRNRGSTKVKELEKLRRLMYLDKEKRAFVDFRRDIVHQALYLAEGAIRNGRIPILFLPDTSMRIAGHLFHAAFIEAFPEVYRKLKRYRLGPVVYVPTKIHSLGRYDSPIKVSIPAVLKKIKNIKPIFIDEIALGRTMGGFNIELERQGLPRSSELKSTDEGRFNVIRDAKDYAKRDVQDVNYLGRGGVLKRAHGPPGTEPEIVTARESDYNKPINFWLEKEYKSYLSRMGRELGQEYRKKQMKK